MKPVYKIMVGDVDITDTIRPFFMSMSIRDDVGLSGDTLSIELSEQDDQGNTLIWPPRGRVLKVWIGYQGQTQTLHYKGAFTVDELGYAVGDQVLTVQAVAADLLGGQAKVLRSVVYESTTLGDILGVLAGRNGWKLAASGVYLNKTISWLAQSDESDLHFLTRLGVLYGATAQVKSGYLVFVATGAMATASGQAMPIFNVELNEVGAGAQYHEMGRGYYTGVQARYSGDDGSGSVMRGSADVLHVLRDVYDSNDQAVDAADAELMRIQGQNNTLSLPFEHGRPEFVAESVVVLGVDWPVVIREQQWVVAGVSHTLGDGLSTSVECVWPGVLESDQ